MYVDENCICSLLKQFEFYACINYYFVDNNYNYEYLKILIFPRKSKNNLMICTWKLIDRILNLHALRRALLAVK